MDSGQGTSLEGAQADPPGPRGAVSPQRTGDRTDGSVRKATRVSCTAVSPKSGSRGNNAEFPTLIPPVHLRRISS